MDLRREVFLIVQVIRAVGARPADSAFGPISVKGFSAERVSGIVRDLHEAGYLVAADVSGLGDSGPRWEASVLTERGREIFEDLAD
jgi:hypothetical protein